MIDSDNIYVAEYSTQQGCYHVAVLSEVLKLNRYNALEGSTNDYQIIGLFEDESEAFIFCNSFSRKQISKSAAHADGIDADSNDD